MSALDADRAEIERFVNAMFMHADEGTFASLRTFTHNAGDPPVDIRGVEINGVGLEPLVQIAFGKASRAARHPKPVVFCAAGLHLEQRDPCARRGSRQRVSPVGRDRRRRQGRARRFCAG